MTMLPIKSIPRWATAMLLVVLLAAAALRLHGIAFGLPAVNDPDELMFELGGLKMLREKTLNPGWFGHPATTTMYALAMLNAGIYSFGHLAGWFPDAKAFAEAVYADPGWIILPGRVLMAGFGVLCIWMTFRLGRDLFGWPTGLAAAALLAVNPVHITYSQVVRSDVLGCVFMLLCLQAAIRIARRSERRDYVSAAGWLGLAVATKWPLAVTSFGVAGAGVLHMLQNPGTRAATVRNLALFALLSVFALLVVSPYLVLDHATVLENLKGEAQPHHLGASGGTPWWNAWWYLRYPLAVGFGLAGLALVVAGLVLTGRNREVRLVILPVLMMFLLLNISQKLVWDRWALPLLPLLSIIAAMAFVRLATALGARLGRRPGLAALVLLAALLAVPLVMTALAQTRERTHDTRQAASIIARQQIPPGSTVLLEHFAWDLLPTGWRFLFPLGDAGCVDVRAFLAGKVKYATIDAMRQGRSNLDFGTVPPGKVESCKADYALWTQYDRYRAESTRFPQENANYARMLATGQIIATIRPVPGKSAGRVVRIVRFGHAEVSPAPLKGNAP